MTLLSRGRPRRLGLAAGLSVLALGCGLALTACASASGATSGSQGPSLSAGLRQRIDAAQNPAGYLIETISTQPGAGGGGSPVVTTVWTDPTNGNAMMQRGTGPSKEANWERDYYVKGILHWDQTQVNYGPRTWWTADDHASAPAKGHASAGPAGGGYTPAAFVREVIDAAAGTIVGHPVIDGRPTIEVSVPMTGSKFKIWVDSRTDKVIRSEKYFLGSLQNLPPMTSDYYWVRTSTARVDLINRPHVPAGFSEIRIGQYTPSTKSGSSGTGKH